MSTVSSQVKQAWKICFKRMQTRSGLSMLSKLSGLRILDTHDNVPEDLRGAGVVVCQGWLYVFVFY